MSLIKKTFKEICKYAVPKRKLGREDYIIYCKCYKGNDAPDDKLFKNMDRKGLICIATHLYFSKCHERWEGLNSSFPWQMEKCPYRNL